MIKINYNNKLPRMGRRVYALRYLLNYVRTWWLFHVVYPNVKYKGFVRVCRGTRFASTMKIRLGENIQFGMGVELATDVVIGNNVLIGSRCAFVGKHDHQFRVPGRTMWDTPIEVPGTTYVGNDVWLGYGTTVVGPITIGSGSIIAAGSVVIKDVPECEVWGGVPARKLKDRFDNEEDRKKHLMTIK